MKIRLNIDHFDENVHAVVQGLKRQEEPFYGHINHSQN
jgi:hypothetical protein